MRKRIPYLLLLFSVLLWGLFRLFPQTMDTLYSFGLYHWVGQGIQTVLSLVPFSLAELALYALVAALAFGLGKGLYVLVAKKSQAAALWKRQATRLWRGCLYLLSAFMLTCGVNYYRVPLEDHLEYELEPASFEELTTLADDMLMRLNNASGYIRRTSADKMNPERTFSQMRQCVQQAYDSLAHSVNPRFGGYYPATKPVMASKGMSYLGIMGFFFPWTLEANINKDVPAFWMPALIAHEQAHVRGFMRENEANFLAYLVGTHSEDPELRYSTLIHTFQYVLSAVYRVDPAAYEDLMERLAPFVQADFKENAQYWASFRTPLAEWSSKVNNAYLKANGQKEGVQSYGKVVDLLLAEQKKAAGMQQNENSSVYKVDSK